MSWSSSAVTGDGVVTSRMLHGCGEGAAVDGVQQRFFSDAATNTRLSKRDADMQDAQHKDSFFFAAQIPISQSAAQNNLQTKVAGFDCRMHAAGPRRTRNPPRLAHPETHLKLYYLCPRRSSFFAFAFRRRKEAANLLIGRGEGVYGLEHNLGYTGAGKMPLAAKRFLPFLGLAARRAHASV